MPTATSASGRTPSTWPRSSGACRSSSRPIRRCRAHSASTRSTSRRCRVVRVVATARRGAAGRPERARRGIAAAVVEHIPDRATLQIGIGGIHDAILELLTGAPRPGHPHRAALRRDHRPRRPRCDHRHAQAAAPPQDRRDVRARHPAALRLDARQRGRRDAAGRLRQRSPHRRPRARLRLHQRDHGGGPDGSVRIRDHGRALLVIERGTGRLRPRGDVLGGRQGVHRPAVDDVGRAAAGSARG